VELQQVSHEVNPTPAATPARVIATPVRLESREFRLFFPCQTWHRVSTNHMLHRSYFHAFTASMLSPIYLSLVELQPYA
jgi:hypothetical protein